MTNLDSILKSRDITLPIKFHLVKATVFPVVMYGCESWTTKKAEHRKIDVFKLWCTGTTQRDGMGREEEEGSGWGTHVYLWRIHFDIWQN